MSNGVFYIEQKL